MLGAGHASSGGDEMDVDKDMKDEALDSEQGKAPLFRARDKTPPPPLPSDQPPAIVQRRPSKRARGDDGLFHKRRRLDVGCVKTNGVEDSDAGLDEIELSQQIINLLDQLIEINSVDYVFKLRSEFMALQVAVKVKRINPLLSLQEKIGTLNYLLAGQEGVPPSQFLCEGLTLQQLQQLEYDESSAPIFTKITEHLESLVNQLTGSPNCHDDSETRFKY